MSSKEFVKIVLRKIFRQVKLFVVIAMVPKSKEIIKSRKNLLTFALLSVIILSETREEINKMEGIWVVEERVEELASFFQLAAFKTEEDAQEFIKEYNELVEAIYPLRIQFYKFGALFE